MVAMKEKKSLFGGALRCAGIAGAMAVASSASAEFVPDEGGLPNYTGNQARNPSGGFILNISDIAVGAAFPGPTTTTVPEGTLHAYSNSFAMGAFVQVNDFQVWGEGRAFVTQYFMVDSAKQVRMEWNLIGTDGDSLAVLWGSSDHFIVNTNGGANSILVTLTPGQLYAFLGDVIVTDESGSDSGFVRLVWVPAPSALALLGLGMLGTRRRRRS